MPETVAVVGTLDSKGPECAFVRDQLLRLGVRTLVVDVGVLGEPGITADVSREQVATAAGSTLGTLRDAADRSSALDVMAEGAGRILADEHAAGRLGGVIGLGGSGGTTVAARAFCALPLGFPRLVVSTVAAMDVRELVGFHDIVLWPSTTDLAGLNALSRRTLRQAAAAVAAMARDAGSGEGEVPHGRMVAMTALGLTTAAATAARDHLEKAGCEVVVFHANGMGGDALEALVAQGDFDGVLDLTLVEMSDSLFGGAGRSESARPVLGGARPVPRILVPGGLDMIKFGPPETVPENLRDRPRHQHSATVTLVRVDSTQAAELGRLLAARVNTATEPVEIVVPASGFSDIDRPGSPFHDEAADEAFVAALRAALDRPSLVHSVDAVINDADFAELVATRLLSLLDHTSDNEESPA